jgi:hypothetical protein
MCEANFRTRSQRWRRSTRVTAVLPPMLDVCATGGVRCDNSLAAEAPVVRAAAGCTGRTGGNNPPGYR